MIFKRSNGEFRETDRVTRFKLIKSGKNWLRAATSNFGLLKVIRGQVEETVVAEVREDAVSAKSRHLVKGLVVAAAVLSATTVANTTFADEVGNEVVSSSTAVSAPSTSTEAAPLTEEGSKEVSAPQNETATETQPSAASSSEVVESAVASDDKAILEQNASEAALLNQIAEKYASNHQNAEQKAAIKEAVAKVQSELPAGDKLTDASAQDYADQRARLSKSVDDMMATLTAAGFTGNTTVNGAPAISAQLAPISTSTSGSVDTNPVISDANGATIEDAAFNKAGYALDPNADRFTFGVWQFLKTNHATGAKTNFDYYATLAVDRSAITGSLSANPDVYLRIVKKSDGSEVYTRTLKAGESNISLPSYITNNNSDVTNTLTYAAANGTNPGNVTFSLVNANLEYETLQIRDTNYPGNEGEDKQNVQTSVPYAKADQTTYYKVVDSSKYSEGQTYTPTGNETVLASYTQTGLAGQQFTASNNREIAGYKQVAATTDSTQKTSGILGKGVVGQKLVELQGGANHYYVKRISEIVDTDGSTVTKFYALDPSQVNNFATSDIGTEDVSKYTLIYTSKVNKAGEEWKADETKVTKVNSKNGDYYIEVNETAGSKSLVITGWQSATETDTYKQMDGTLHTYPRPFKGAPSTSLTPAGAGNNSYNVIAGKVPVIQAEGSVADDPTAPNGKVYSNLKGYVSFSNNYSIPTAIKPSTDVNYYFVKSDVKGNVYVHYQDTEGKTIKPDVTDEKDQPINKAYDTVVDNRPNEIQFEGKTYELVPAGNYTVGEVDDQGHLTSSDPTTGKVAEEDKNVTYIYKLKEKPKGSVFVHYKDTEGNELKTSVTDMDKEPVDSDYDTVVDNRPKEIEKDGKTYELVPAGTYTVGEVDDQGHLTSSDPTTGKVAEEDKNVTYIYKLKEKPKGSVFVHYKDTEGNELKTSVTDMDKEPVDSDYDTVVDNRPKEIEKDGKTYELVPAGTYTVGEVDDQGHLTSSDPTTGKVAEEDKNVTYIYKLKEKPKGSVFVHYKDTEGNELKTSVTDMDKEPVDSDYDTVVDNRPKEIEKDGKTYELVPAGTYTVGEVDDQGHLTSSDPTTGKVAEEDKNVTYIYKLKEKPKGSVFVHYKDTEGNELKTSVTDMDKEPVDSAYDTVVDNRPEEIEKDGKTYVLVPAGTYTVGEVDDQGHLTSSDPTTGKVAEQDKNVTYVYKLKETPAEPKGNVYVHYVDTEGKTIKADVTDEEAQPVDKDYDTVVDNRPQEIEFEGKTYELVPAGNYTVGEVDDQGHLKSTDPTTGKVIEGDKNVTYVYKLKETPAEPKGNVYVHYVDTEGKTIKADVTDEEAQPVDKDYDTVVDNRPEEIEKDGKTYVLVPAGNYTVGEVDDQGHLKSTDPTTGKVIEGDKNVTYVYKLKETPAEPKGNVYVHYVDTEGKTIKADVTDEDAQPVDKDYDTVVDNRPEEIEKDGKTYVLVPAGNYTVGEVDDQGHLKSTDPTTGKVIEGDKNVTYVYKLKETPAEPKGNVYVHYVDTEGKTIKADVTDEDAQPVDKDYDTVVDNRPQEIEFEGKTYELVPAGNYTVGEVDDQGHLKSTDPTTGKVIEGDKNVTYVYKLKETPAEPKGNVYVHYVDTEGKTIKADVTDEEAQPVDKDYDTVVDNRPEEIEKDGKTYVLVPAGNYTVGEVDDQGHLKSTDPTTGKVIEGDKNVTYVYKLKETPTEPKGNVYVHYVDTEGKTIKADVTDEEAQPVDKDYDTVVDNRPQEIEFEGKTYELVPAGNYTVGEVDDQGHLKSTDPTTGKVIEGDKNVTYVYKLKETPTEPKGNVYVHYVDTEGKTIKADVTDEDAQPVDKDYDTVVDNRPQEIEFEGKTYELVPAGNYTVGEVDDQGHLKSTDPTTGKVIEGDKNVTYVYKLKETPAEPKKGEVVITYVDENGKEIEKPRQDTPNSPYDTPYNTTEEGEKPNTIKTPDGKTYKIVPKGDYPVGKVDEDGHLESSDPVKGKVDKPKSTITYVYKEVKGNVYVHYVDTEGKTIKSDVTDEEAQPVDKDYNTVVDNRPQEIEFEGKTYELVPAGNYTVGEVDDQGHLKSTDPTTGKVIEGDKNVTYVYKLKETPAEPKGNVYVHYVDTEGKTIKADVTDEEAQPVDKDYDTVVDNRPQTIEKDGKTYELVPAGNYTVGEVDDQGHLKSTDPTTGKVIEGDKNVTYVYKLKETPAEPKKGEVVITYVDENGKEIEKPRQDTPNSPYDTPYNTTEEGEKPNTIKTPDGKTYKIVPKGDYPVGKVDEDGHLESSDPVKGKVDKPKSTITYVYKEVKGNVYVHYVDTEGKTIKSDVTDEEAQPVDKDYNTVVDNRPQEIEFEGKTYELVPAGNYTVGEVDDQGHLKSTDPTTGKVIEGDKNVTYVYKLKETPTEPKKGEVVITYVDENGKEIEKPRQDTPNSPYDTPYNTTEEGEKPNTIKTPDGKTYKIVPKGDYPVGKVDEDGHLESSDPVKGKVDKPKSTITYVYKEVKGNVYVHYKDTEGNELKPSVTDEENQPVDKDYNTVVDNRPQTIEKDGKTYELVPAGNYTVGEVDDEGHLKSTDPTTGKVIEGDKNVTYIYKLVKSPDKPVEPTPDKPVEPTPDKPVEPTPDKPVEPTPGKPVDPTPGKPVDPTPGKPVNPTPGKPVDPTPGKPVNPTPGKPVDPTPGKPVDPTPGKPVDPTPGKGQLPNTGETTSVGSTVLGLVAGLVGLAALGRRKEEDEK